MFLYKIVLALNSIRTEAELGTYERQSPSEKACQGTMSGRRSMAIIWMELGKNTDEHGLCHSNAALTVRLESVLKRDEGL